MMTKRLPQLPAAQNRQPYKYQDLRRKYKGGADSGNASGGEDEFRPVLGRERSQLATARSNSLLNTHRTNASLAAQTGRSNTSLAAQTGRSNTSLAPTTQRSNTNLLSAVGRSNTNLATSRDNLARSNTNLAGSRESLAIPEEIPEKSDVKASAKGLKHPATESKDSIDNLRDDLNKRQASLEQFASKRTEHGKQVYSFMLSKTDRSKSDSILFPPLKEKQRGQKLVQANQPHNAQNIKKSNENLNSSQEVLNENTDHAKDNKENSKPISTVKFPLVSRYDLYKHLGISQPQRRKRVRRDSEVAEIRNYTRAKPPIAQSQQNTPRIVPGERSGGSRNPSALVTKDEKVPNKKLEMYKQWHEKQMSQRHKPRDYDTKEAARLANIYKDKYPSNELKPHHRNPERLPTRHKRDATLPKIGLKDRTNAGSRQIENSNQNDGSQTERSRHNASRGGASNSNPHVRTESPPAPVPEDLLRRKYSAKTWRTWRHHDDSYAYDNVDEYIDENELMDEEKIYFIKQWIMSVARARENTDESDDDSDEQTTDDVTTVASNDHTDKSVIETQSNKV